MRDAFDLTMPEFVARLEALAEFRDEESGDPTTRQVRELERQMRGWAKGKR